MSATTAKVAPQVGGLANKFADWSDNLGGTIKSMERFSRGIRGVTPELAAHRERIYSLENSLKAVGREMDSATLRLEERRKAEQLAIQTGKDLELRLGSQTRSFALTSTALDQAKAKLNDLRTSTTLNAEAVAAQEIKYKEADAALETYQRKMVETKDKIAALIDREGNFSLELDKQAGNILKVQQRLETIRTEYQQHEDAINKLTARETVAHTEVDKMAASIARLNESSKNFYDQAAVESTKLQQALERNINAEIQEEEAKYRKMSAMQKQHEIEAGQLAQKLSTMAKSGPNGKTTPEYRDTQLEQRKMMALQQQEAQQLDVLKAKIAALRIEETNYQSVLDQKASLVNTLIAKGNEEEAQANKLAGEMLILAETHKGLATDIQSHRDAISKLSVEEANLITKEKAEMAALESLEKEQQAAVNRRKTLEATYEQQVLKSNELARAYAKEQQALNDLRTSGGASAADIAKQEKAVEGLEKAWEKERNELQNVERAVEQNEMQQTRLNLEVQNGEKRLKDLADTQERYGAALANASAQEQKAIEKQEQKASKLDKVKAKVKETTDNFQKQGGILGWLTGLFGRHNSTLSSAESEMKRTATVAEAVNSRLFSLGATLRDLAVGTASGFFANSLSNWISGLRSAASTGLDTYKSNEMLSMSLTALAQRQLVATGQYKSLDAAQGAAAKMSEDLLGWMKQLAIQSPFGVDDISGAFRLGNALGFTSDQAKNLIQYTVDWASATGGTGQSIEGVIRALGQMHNTGHVTLEDLNQMTDAGLGARDVLRKEFAPEIANSKMSLEDMISAGILPADRAINALSRSMKDDFGGAAAKSGDSMTGLINSLQDLKNQGLAQFFTSTFKAVQKPLGEFVAFLQSGEVTAAVTNFGNMLGSSIGSALTWLKDVAFPGVTNAIREFGPRVIEGFSFFAALVSEAWEWGYGIGEQFSLGLSATIDGLMDIINSIADTISYWMEPHSPPKFLPEIDIWGKKTGQVYIDALANPDMTPLTGMQKQMYQFMTGDMSEKAGTDSANNHFAGWSQADFSLLTGVTNKVRDVLQDMVDVGGLDKGVALQALIGTESQMADAINEMKQLGSVSQATFDRIKKAAGPAGDQVMAYVQAMMQNEAATRAAEKAQAELDQITKDYDAKINPLKAKLDALHGKTDDNAAAKEKAYLQELLTLQNSPGLQIDKDAVRARIQEIDLQREIDSQEKQKQAAVDTAQAKLDAAKEQQEAAAKQLDFQQSLLDMQKEQIDLIKQQQALEKGDDSGKSPEEIAKEDAAAKEKYEFDKASTADQIKMLEAKQAAERQGSAKWFELQAEIEQKQDELANKADKASAKTDKEAEKAQKEAEKRAKAEMEVKLAAAETEEEKLSILEDYQQTLKSGSTEYLAVQKRIEQQKDAVTKANDKEAKSIAKASEAEFDHQLAMADSTEKAGMLEERLKSLDPTSKEYTKRTEELKKAQDANAKASKQLTDAEFESAFAAQNKAGKISMLHEKLNGLNEGSLEYEKTLKRLNTLENPGSGGGGHKKKKPKPGDISGGGPLDEFKDVGKSIGEVKNSFVAVTQSVDKAKASFASFKEKLDPIFKWLKENSGIIVYVLQKLAMSFVVAVAMEKIIKPLMGLIWGLRQFLTWGNAVWALVTILGYSWKYNIGGLRDIVFDVWAKIQGPLTNLKNIFQDIVKAFQGGGVGAAWDALKANFAALGDNIGAIGGTVWGGVTKWLGPLVEKMGELFGKLADWAQGGGLTTLLVRFMDAVGEFFSSNSVDKIIGTGILGLIGGAALAISSLVRAIGIEMLKAWPGLADSVSQGWAMIGEWFHKYSFLIIPTIQTALIALVGVLGELLVPALVFIGKRIIDIATWLIPMLPDILAGLLNTIMLLLSWLVGRGVPLVLAGLWDLLAYAFQKVGEMLPDLGLNLGKAIGSVVSTLFVALIGAIGGLIASLVISIWDGSFLARLQAMVKGLSTFFEGLFKGIINLVIGFLLGLVEPLVNVGRALIMGLGEGWTGGVADFFRNLVAGFDYVIAMVKNYLGIHSPSTVFAEIGSFLIQGLIQGLSAIVQLGAWLVARWVEMMAFIYSAIVNGLAAVAQGWVSFVGNVTTIVVGFIGWLGHAWLDGLLYITVAVINFFGDLLAKFGINKDDLIAVVTSLHDNVSRLWQNAIDWLTTTITKYVDWLKLTIETSRDNVVKAITDLKDKFIGVITTLKDTAVDLFNKMVDLISGGATTMKTNVTGTVDTMGTLLSGAWNSIKSTAENAWSGAGGIVSKITDAIGKAKDAVAEFFTGAGDSSLQGLVRRGWNAATSIISGVADSVAQAVSSVMTAAKNSIVDGINNLIGKINDAIDEINNASYLIGGPHISHLDYLEYALGTMRARAGWAIVGENGPELVQMGGGESVTPASRTMAMFEDSAKRMIADVTRALGASIDQMQKSQDRAAASLERAAAKSSAAANTTAATTQITNNNTVTHETHHHWNMTVNTQATTPTVVDDYATMQAYANLA